MFRDAVRMRLMADVPLGTFLSGGIDSAAITAVMASLIEEPVRTFSVAFEEREANELVYARMVAKKFGTEHREGDRLGGGVLGFAAADDLAGGLSPSRIRRAFRCTSCRSSRPSM
jgi:hypothetical protein